MKLNFKKFFIFPLIAILTLTAACGNEKASNDSLDVMLDSNIVSLDSSQVTDLGSLEVIADCIDGLMQLDAKGNAAPAIAESFEVSADGKQYIFHLRDAKWANGDPVTADDFVFAWRRHCHNAGEYAYIFGSTVACVKNADAVIKGADVTTLGVTAKDAKTLVVDLEAPVSFFPALMAFPTFYPINEKFYNTLKEGSYGTSPETFLSNGAFVIAEYVPGAAAIKFKKNETYWDAARVALNNLQYQIVSSSDNALTAYKNHTLQIVQLTGNQVEHAKSDKALAKNLKSFSSGDLVYLSFNQDPKNHHGGALANKNLRLAISNAVDRESLADNYLMDGSLPTYTAVPRQFAPNAATGEYFAEDQKRYSDVVGFNVERAKEYLKKAKQELNRDKIDLQIIYSNEGAASAKIVQAIKSQVEANLDGVTITLQPMPKAEYLKNVTSDNYDIALTNWAPDYDDPMTFLSLWTTTGGEMSEHWSNPAYDKIINDCTTGALASNYEGRWKALYDAEKMIMDEAIVAPLFTGARTLLIADGVEGVDFHAVGVVRVFKSAKYKK